VLPLELRSSPDLLAITSEALLDVPCAQQPHRVPALLSKALDQLYAMRGSGLDDAANGAFKHLSLRDVWADCGGLDSPRWGRGVCAVARWRGLWPLVSDLDQPGGGGAASGALLRRACHPALQLATPS
jgi:hypothetical protein